jgi:hypothetical protein
MHQSYLHIALVVLIFVCATNVASHPTRPHDVDKEISPKTTLLKTKTSRLGDVDNTTKVPFDKNNKNESKTNPPFQNMVIRNEVNKGDSNKDDRVGIIIVSVVGVLAVISVALIINYICRHN